MRVESRPIADVRPYAGNPRKIPKRAVDAVAASIEQYGFRQPIVVDTEGVVIAGHTRLHAAQKLGLESVPVHVADLTPEQARAYRLADNRTNEFAAWDDETLAQELATLSATLDTDLAALSAMTAFDTRELDRLLGPPPGQTDPDDVPENADPVTQPGDVWLLGQHRLMCGDSTSAEDVVHLLDGTKPDCILTDPPYSSGGFQESGKSAGSKGSGAAYRPIENDRRSTRGYMALMKQVLRATSPVSVVYVFTDWRMWIHTFDVAESSGYGVRSMIVWDKGTPGMGMGWRAQHELILCGTRENGLWKKHQGAQGNVIAMPRIANELHATQKPVQLLMTMLKATPFAGTVYDPFFGSGSAMIAAERVGRTCFGMELDPFYVDIAVARWAAYTGEKAVRC